MRSALVLVVFSAAVLLQRFRARRTIYYRSASPRVSHALEFAFWEKFRIRAVPASNQSTSMVDFEWTNSKSTKPTYAKSWNRLCGGMRCLEDKRILGLILNKVDGALQTFTVASAKDLEMFWDFASRLNLCSTKRFWVLKDSRANGASGVWFLDLENGERDLQRGLEIIGNSEAGFCLQEFCPRPLMLWHSRKFHFRVTAVVCANARVFVHRLAFLHPANKSFSEANVLDPQVQLTNLCSNMQHAANNSDFVGEICLDLEQEYPQLWPRVLEMWRNTVDAAFECGMRHQRCAGGDFEYVGLDVMANELGQVFLLEINSPPALYSATRQPQADAMHEEMLKDLFQHIVAPALLGSSSSVQSHGGFVEVLKAKSPPPLVQFWDTWHSAQSKCDVLLMRFLMQARKRQDQQLTQ